MGDAGIVIDLAADDETALLVKGYGVGLCGKPGFGNAPGPQMLEYRPQHGPTDALAARLRQDGHAADFPAVEQPGATYGNTAPFCQDVFGRVIETIPFQFRRHVLLLDEYALANVGELGMRFRPRDERYIDTHWVCWSMS